MDELIEIIMEYFKFDEKTGFELLLNIVEEVKDNEKNFIRNLLDKIEEKALELDLCPCCYEKLETSKNKEYSEAWGKPVYEEIIERYCLNCGYESKNF